VSASAEKAAGTAKTFESNGQSSPLGATLVPGGANFSLYSRNASAVELLLFDREDDAQPARVITLDPFYNRTYHDTRKSVRPACRAQTHANSESVDLTTPRTVCGLTPRRFYSTHMGAV
jgi:pullulanase/glycogen debranching enzyme